MDRDVEKIGAIFEEKEQAKKRKKLLYKTGKWRIHSNNATNATNTLRVGALVVGVALLLIVNFIRISYIDDPNAQSKNIEYHKNPIEPEAHKLGELRAKGVPADPHGHGGHRAYIDNDVDFSKFNIDFGKLSHLWTKNNHHTQNGDSLTTVTTTLAADADTKSKGLYSEKFVDASLDNKVVGTIDKSQSTGEYHKSANNHFKPEADITKAYKEEVKSHEDMKKQLFTTEGGVNYQDSDVYVVDDGIEMNGVMKGKEDKYDTKRPPNRVVLGQSNEGGIVLDKIEKSF